MSKIQVFDNIISQPHQQYIEEVCLGGGPCIKWLFNDSTVGLSERLTKWKSEVTVDTPQMTHGFFDDVFNDSAFEFHDGLILPIKFNLEELSGLKLPIERVKANILFNTGNTDTNIMGMPHSDMSMAGYMAGVYYVNDSDGDTILFENFDKPDVYSPYTPVKLANKVELRIEQRVTPKRGRLVLFEANRLHCSSNPIVNNTRCVLNFIFKLEK